MRTRWYICTLFLIFAVFGALQKQTSLPNQEIALQFANSSVKQQDINSTIAKVKEKLLTSGVQNITIQKINNNTLKISYHSVTDINTIKKALNEHDLVVDKNPSDKDKQSSFTYSIDVYELHDNSNTSKPNENYILEVKFGTDRSLTSYASVFLRNSEIQNANQLFRTKYKSNTSKALAQDQSSHTKPEVRAGPSNSSL
ncbi:hypothetical protein DUT90_12760 [Polaribacter sp. WD7]|uniref:hypothetical protein n=1 Tax=Polaribacter sp. WD7 TaxID=2269061 RepID=UPI000DF11BCA|nr:hypothetical protein [Polaribacter sp. WD7]RCS26614.1 hypothetical protein DUT90_12760 [Polaribacter sp. WD7]